MSGHTIPELGGTWKTIEYIIARAVGGGSDKKLITQLRFDGNGDAVVYHIVVTKDYRLVFVAFDAAVQEYNGLP